MNLISRFLVLISLSVFLFACKEEKIEVEKNTITTNLEVDGFLTVEPEQEFSFIIQAENPELIQSFNLSLFRNGDLIKVIVDSTIFPTDKVTYENKSKSNALESIDTYVFSYLNKNGTKFSKEIKINVVGRIISYNTKLFRSDREVTNIASSISLYSGKVFTNQNAKNSNLNIDLFYTYTDSVLCLDDPCNFFIDSVSSAIGSPNSKNIRYFFNHPTFGIQTWSNRNKTTFKNLGKINQEDFDKIYNENVIVDLAKGTFETIIPFLQEDQFIAFKTVNSKFGIIRVKSLQPGYNGNIELSVKIQKF